MPFSIDFGNPPSGYAVTAARAGEQVAICSQEFTSSEDGQYFIKRLEGFPSEILQQITPPIRPSQVDNMLAICHGDGKGVVYVNELVLQPELRAALPVEAGTVITKDAIADVERLNLGVQIPDDAGFLFVFSVGWRKGLFYDFVPISPTHLPRPYDIDVALGQALCHVLFQERFSISDKEWDSLFAEKWFPFVGLRNDSIDMLINCVRYNRNPDERLEDIVCEVKDRAPQMLDSWRKRPSFESHLEILERAIERFQGDDYMSCTALLVPRIEGILRTQHASIGAGTNPTSKNLAETAVVAKVENDNSLLLPRRFKAYLDDVYFANFNPSDTEIEVTRHSVAHGVASASSFDKKSALIHILVVHQLFYFLGSP